MNTKRVLVISGDKELRSVIRMSAVTLTKLNCQIALNESEDSAEGMVSANTDLIILDADIGISRTLEIIKGIRNNADISGRKIITLCETETCRSDLFAAGCDSIMSKKEFYPAVNNILTV